MTTRLDIVTRTEADAGRWERRFGPQYDDRPSLSDVMDVPDVIGEDEYEREYRDRDEDNAWRESVAS